MKTDYYIHQVIPEKYLHWRAFTEVVQSVQGALHDLGYNAPVLSTGDDTQGKGRPIVFGANLLDREINSSDKIIFNLEQITPNSPWLSDAYISILKASEVWDYSDNNIAELAKLGVTAKKCGIGYHPCLERITQLPESEKDIDVLHIGSINARRQKILDELRSKGLKVEAAFNVYGKERDALVARAKIVINIHYYDSKVFEIVRCSYLMANKAYILSEFGADLEMESLFYDDGMTFTHYDVLADKCMHALKEINKRESIARKGYEIFSEMKQSDMLRKVIEC